MTLATHARAEFATGDILISNWSTSNVEQYSPSGTLKQTFTGTGSHWLGTSPHSGRESRHNV